MSTASETTATVTTIPSKTDTAAQTKKKRLTIVGVVVGAIAIYAIYDYFFFVSTDNAQVQGNTVILNARVSGFVSKVLVEEGQKVKAGDVLVEIDAKDYKSRTSQSENELGSVVARAKDAEVNYHRIQKLFEDGAVSAQQRDSALATYQEFARKREALEAQLDVTKNSMNDTQLRAPSNGTIAKKSAEIGMLASPGTPLIGFVSSDSRWIVANFKETDLGRLKVGQKVSVSVDAIPGRKFDGEVESFNPATGAIFSLLPPDNATGNFTKVVQRVPTRIKLLNINPEDIEILRAGLSAVVEVKVH
ncbi:MAG: HlyD family secretion protein [Bdellovibrionales bacterium]|nr:HlyD family secretion protein [Bdellovibrionales bacterium]